jgi:hypothetical protein
VRGTLVAVLVFVAPAAAIAGPSPQADQDALYQKLWAAPPAATPMPKAAASFGGDRIAQRLAGELSRRYGVQVLSAQRERRDGKPVYRMVVMNPGGDFNSAFAVHTLVVDAATGQLVSQFQNETSGYQLPAPPDRALRDSGTATAIRRETFSKP